ncbi:isoprene synthase, chloroplastic-like [Coffea eugenioides]|uniref:isoprene synthase, chloroplastic-like n=1 Tax=Coffea eugenioides TaxID=49369 RepID=UPI000F613C06|nr:isoprene synthase, chloroplastic-like [Coffea eugenioides]
MVQVLVKFPLTCIQPNLNILKKNSRSGPLHHAYRVQKTWQTRCSNQSAELTIDRRTANYQPSSWSHILFEPTSETDNEWENQTKILNKLENEVGSMLDCEDLDPQALIELINDIDQLGLSYRYRQKIKTALKKLRDLEDATGEKIKSSLHTSALYFRLLRQHGFEVSPDIFERFKDQNGNFNENLAGEIRGMLSLFEASHLAYEGENILNEAKSFASLHLKDSKEFVGSNMSEQITHALELPYHHRMRRLEARWRIEAYAKRSAKNQVLLELAKLDFNLVQSQHQSEVQEVSRWWKVVGLADKLDFARDRLMESFFWSVGIAFEPRFSKCRMAVTKAFTLITVLDDIYDIYGSLDELEQFTDAIVRWDLDAMKDLPEYMKLCFLALYNTISDLAYDTLKDKGEIIIPQLKKAWADLCKAFLQEAQWFYKKATPNFDEYIENGWISVSGAVQLIHAYFLVTENISKEAIECLDYHHDFLHWPCIIFRLTNDLSSSTAEIERGETTNAITCFMHETGLSEEFARQHISKMIEECWMKMNKQLLSQSPYEENFIQVAMDLARTALCQYQHGDAHSAPDVKAKNRIMSVLLDPIRLRETEDNATEYGDNTRGHFLICS